MSETKLTEAQERMKERLCRELRFFTEHNDLIILTDDNAETIADIFAEFVRAALSQEPRS